MTIDFQSLAAEFPRQAVSWRSQSLTRNGDKALALAYIDARDVMRRLDEVCGPENWQDSYTETAKGRVIATILIRIDDQWIGKSDGAGDTAVEGEKGGISDAFKRAAVKWGIGRYLYDLDATWVPCETYEANGKKHWKRWTVDPWSCVRSVPSPAPAAEQKPASKADSRELYARLSNKNRELATVELFNRFWAQKATQDAVASLPADFAKELNIEKQDKAAELHERAELASEPFDLNGHLDNVERESAGGVQ